MSDICSYEEARRQRLQENRKRFEDLGISKTLVEITKNKLTTPKKERKCLMKLAKPSLTEMEPRRSSRVRNAVPSYYDEIDIDLPSLRKHSRSYPSSWTSNVARPLDEVKVATYEERIRAVKVAEKMQASLNSENPSFVKSMLRSHVYSCFWLGLPSKFCEEYLPKKQVTQTMVLEDENGSEYEAKYISSRVGLSGGWRGFALDHKLDDGDAVVFELVEPERFKVYIIRAHNAPTEEPTENDEENIETITDSCASGKKKKGTSMADAATPISSVGSRRSTRLKAKE